MDVNQFLSSLKNLEKTRNFNAFKDYSLDSFQAVLESFGLAERTKDILRISIVGTNGKGSISHFLSQIAFRSNEFSNVGVYTSPHLLRQNERIQLNGSPVEDEWLNSKLNSFSKQELERLRTLSYFEFFTFLAMLYFEDNHCNLEVYEAGLGGRLDATKLTFPDLVILTKIDLDHTEILGDTEEKILLEKLQIVSERTKRVYTFLQEKKILKTAENFCRESNLDLIIYEHHINLDYLSFNKNFSLFVLNHIQKERKRPVIEDSILPNIPNIPGRMQVIRENPILLFDIGHNPSAVHFLLQSINNKYPEEKKWNVYFGCLKDKDARRILERLIMNISVEKIFQLSDDGWNPDTILNSKIKQVSELEFTNTLKSSMSACIVLGSFRLYSLVIENVL